MLIFVIVGHKWRKLGYAFTRPGLWGWLRLCSKGLSDFFWGGAGGGGGRIPRIDQAR